MNRILHPVVPSASRATRPIPVDVGKERNDVRWDDRGRTRMGSAFAGDLLRYSSLK